MQGMMTVENVLLFVIITLSSDNKAQFIRRISLSRVECNLSRRNIAGIT